jgi:hypothetical protein
VIGERDIEDMEKKGSLPRNAQQHMKNIPEKELTCHLLFSTGLQISQKCPEDPRLIEKRLIFSQLLL